MYTCCIVRDNTEIERAETCVERRFGQARVLFKTAGI